MPCTFRDNVVLVPDALSGLLIHPAPTTKNKSYTPVPQGKIIYRGWRIKTIVTICMSYLRGAKLIVLLQMNDYLATLKPLTLFLADGSLFYTYYIKIIKNGGWKHQTYQLLKDR